MLNVTACYVPKCMLKVLNSDYMQRLSLWSNIYSNSVVYFDFGLISINRADLVWTVNSDSKPR